MTDQIDVSQLRLRASAVLMHSRNKPDIPPERQDEIAKIEGKPVTVTELALIAEAAGIDPWWIIDGERAPDVVDPPPVNVDLFIPEPMSREDAVKWLGEHLDSSISHIFGVVIAPLYDRLNYEERYQNGFCRLCQVRHPRLWEQKHPDRPWPGHTMSCPRYIGPVEHRRTRFEQAGETYKLRCTCGHKWNATELTDETKKCPSQENWRGPLKEEVLRD